MKILLSKAKRKLTGIMLLLVLAAPFLLAKSFQNLPQDRDVWEKLKKGKIVAQISKLPESNTYNCKAMGIVYAPRQLLWRILSDYNNFKYFMPNIKESFVVSSDGLEAFPEIKNNQVKDWPQLEKKLLKFKQLEIENNPFYFYNRFNLPWPLKDRYYILKMKRLPEDFTFSWTLYAGNTKINEGSWQLIPFPGNRYKTLAVYRLLTNPGVSVSAGLIKIAIRITLPGTIKALRKRALKLSLEERKNARS
ncbi:MAG: SRPBCC family protein [Candidatus Aminicenantales bacterium]